jgi:Leucine-rich repeat (LRR) protein
MEINMLEVLPREIGNLTKLQSLIFWNNKITSIPVEIGKLSALRTIQGSDNLI